MHPAKVPARQDCKKSRRSRAWSPCKACGVVHQGLTHRSSGLAPAGHFRPSFHSGPYVSCRREPLTSNVRPKANQVGAKVQACALASRSSPEALHNRPALWSLRRTSAPCSGCPSFGGQRTLVAARTRYALAHANRFSSSEQSLKSIHAPSQGASTARLQEESPVQSLVALQSLWCRPPRPNPSVERTRTGRPLQALISFWALRVLPARAAHLNR